METGLEKTVAIDLYVRMWEDLLVLLRNEGRGVWLWRRGMMKL